MASWVLPRLFGFAHNTLAKVTIPIRWCGRARTTQAVLPSALYVEPYPGPCSSSEAAEVSQQERNMLIRVGINEMTSQGLSQGTKLPAAMSLCCITCQSKTALVELPKNHTAVWLTWTLELEAGVLDLFSFIQAFYHLESDQAAKDSNSVTPYVLITWRTAPTP